jgi:hypothetical protein
MRNRINSTDLQTLSVLYALSHRKHRKIPNFLEKQEFYKSFTIQQKTCVESVESVDSIDKTALHTNILFYKVCRVCRKNSTDSTDSLHTQNR